MLCSNRKYITYSKNPSFRSVRLLIIFFSHSIIRSGNRSGSYVVNGGLENLEQLHPLDTDCAGHLSTTWPHFGKSVLLINIFLKTNDISEPKIAYFPISIHSILPLQVVCRCMQFMTIK